MALIDSTYVLTLRGLFRNSVLHFWHLQSVLIAAREIMFKSMRCVY
jgi:hypothetical protein